MHWLWCEEHQQNERDDIACLGAMDGFEFNKKEQGMSKNIVQYTEAWPATAKGLETERRANEAALVEVRSLVVNDEHSSAFVAETLRDAKESWRILEDKRKEIVKPLNDEVKMVNSAFKPALFALEQVEHLLKKRIADYIQEREAATRAVLAAAAAAKTSEEATAALAEVSAPVTVPAGMSMRMAWKACIVNEDRVPREFCSPDPRKIDAWLRSMTAEGNDPSGMISGVEFRQEPVMSVRR